MWTLVCRCQQAGVSPNGYFPLFFLFLFISFSLSMKYLCVSVIDWSLMTWFSVKQWIPVLPCLVFQGHGHRKAIDARINKQLLFTVAEGKVQLLSCMSSLILLPDSFHNKKLFLRINSWKRLTKDTFTHPTNNWWCPADWSIRSSNSSTVCVFLMDSRQGFLI